MKILFCVIIVFCGGYVGIAISHEYDKRLTFFKEFKAFLHFFSIKIAFSKESLFECINLYMDQSKPKNKKFFTAFASNSKVGEFSQDLVKTISAKLSDAEYKELLAIIKNLGTTDYLSQKDIISSAIADIDLKIDNCMQDKKTKGDIYKKIGVCVGLLACILIY